MGVHVDSRILIVDDDALQLQALRDVLHDHGYKTEGFTSGETALASFHQGQFDLLLTDLTMPGMGGVEVLSSALEIDPHIVGVLMTGQGTIETAVEAMKAGALDYVLKPIRVRTILPVLSRAMEVRRLRLQNVQLRNTVAIHELNEAIAHTLDPDVLLEKILDAALAQFQGDEGSVMLLSEDGESLHVAAVRGERRELLLGTQVRLGSGVSGRVATQREPVLLEGLTGVAELAPMYPRGDIQSALSLPMITRGKLIGVLNVNAIRDPGAFSSGQVEVMHIFTNAAAAGIEAARLYNAQRKADARYSEILHMAADAIVSLDEEYRIILFNGAAERIFGWKSDEVLGKSLDMLIPDRLVDEHRRHIQAFEQAPVTTVPMRGRGPFYARHKDGTEFPAEISISRLREDDRHVYTAVLRDITHRLKQEDRIARLTRLYSLLSGVNAAIVRITDETELFLDICQITTEKGGFMFAYVGVLDPEAAQIRIVTSAGIDLEGVQFQLAPLVADAGSLWACAINDRIVTWDNDLAANPDSGYQRRKFIAKGARAAACLPFAVDGTLRAVMILYADTRDAFGDEEIKLLREMAGDVSFALAHLEMTRRMNYLATHDQLTGLPNRTLFLDRLAQALAVIKAGDNPDQLAIVLVDVERFKKVNDALGRQAGDKLLELLAGRISGAVTERASLARVGADVFAMIMRSFTQASDVAKTLGQELNQVMTEPFNIEGQALHMAVRAGVALAPADGLDAEILYHNAEAALRRAKSQQHRVSFYTPDLNARVAEQLSLESRLRHALERDEFVLHYQPKVDLATGSVVGLEALIRWQDTDGKLVSPAQFIPLLEETGLILQVGRWAMLEAMRANSVLRRAGVKPPMRIAVNVSPIQLRQAEFVRSVEDAVVLANGQPIEIDLEITESVIMDDIQSNVLKLTEIRALGIELAIDDFGTGYSSLAYMARLPVDVIKIDRTFIRNLAEDLHSREIVSSIISLTRSLNRKVVAEGVETDDQAQLLRKLGCDQYQGFLFSKPVPLADVTKLLLSLQST